MNRKMGMRSMRMLPENFWKKKKDQVDDGWTKSRKLNKNR